MSLPAVFSRHPNPVPASRKLNLKEEKLNPLLTCYFGLACMNCFRGAIGERGVKLTTCTNCKRVLYCSADCQKADWENHESICRALHAMEDKTSVPIPGFLPEKAVTDRSVLDALIEQVLCSEIETASYFIGRPLSDLERNLIVYQPRCLACTRTDRHLRLESSPARFSYLKTCATCQMAFYCSQEHWEAVDGLHHQRHDDCHEYYDTVPRCQLYFMLKLCTIFHVARRGNSAQGRVSWTPKRINSSWVPLFNTSWVPEYSLAVKQEDLGLPAVFEDFKSIFFQQVTENLTYPLTILWGLENLLPEQDVWTNWTKKRVLQIHILGAWRVDLNVEFEEILHRLPELEELLVVFCGPELADVVGPPPLAPVLLPLCPECKTKRRMHLRFFPSRPVSQPQHS